MSSISTALEGERSQSSLCGAQFGFCIWSQWFQISEISMVERLSPQGELRCLPFLNRLVDEDVDDRSSLPG